ncbi:hypothetical protein MBLNU230_g5779t1 [Neophaeotheca triangularis]
MAPNESTQDHPTEAVEEPVVEAAPVIQSDMEPRPEEKHHPHSDLEGVEAQRPSLNLQHTRSHLSATHDIAGEHHDRDEHFETGDEIYERFSPKRKLVIVAILSFSSFLAPVGSTMVLSAIPEVAAEYSTSGTVINVSNALYLIFMGLSPLLWGPLGQVYGRKWTLAVSSALFTAFSIGTALAPNLASYFVFRMLTAYNGTSFLIIGSSCIGDIYRPVDRATALGWFLSGTLIGPALGPFIGGIIVTFRSWRDLFWLQTALAGTATLAVTFFLPETIHYAKKVELQNLSKTAKAKKFWSWTNPARVVKLFRYPNLCTAGLASGALVWNMYSLLTPIRYVLNPRFGLDSPLQSGLFYIAPGCGYLVGTFFGGRWADRVVKKNIRKRGGERVPEDRLKSCLSSMGIVIPGCMLIYGWAVDQAVGGIPLPVIVMFVQGVAQLFCFPSLNTYCLDVMGSGSSSEVIAGNYLSRYIFAAAGSAACLPIIEAIGIGWFSTISALFLVASTVTVWATTVWGPGWRQKVTEHHGEKKAMKEQH